MQTTKIMHLRLRELILPHLVDKHKKCKRYPYFFKHFVATLVATCHKDLQRDCVLYVQLVCGSFYCSYLWTHYKKSSFSKIRVAYNNLYRNILHVSRRSSVSAMFVQNNIPDFE